MARLVLAHTTFCIPYVFLSVKSRLVGMDQSLFDAARDLGARPAGCCGILRCRCAVPAILSGAFLALAMSLDDFVISFFVYGAGEGTLPLKIYSSVKVGVSPRVNALCSLMIAVVFLAVATQRYVQAVRKAREKTAERNRNVRIPVFGGKSISVISGLCPRSNRTMRFHGNSERGFES